jgi:hypothetical protein
VDLLCGKPPSQGRNAMILEQAQQQVQLDRAMQVVRDTSQRGLFHLLPVATHLDCPATPALDHGDDRLRFPPLAINRVGNSQLHLAAIGLRRRAALRPADGDSQ